MVDSGIQYFFEEISIHIYSYMYCFGPNTLSYLTGIVDAAALTR